MCLNVHGIFPYLMVPYSGPSWMESENVAVQHYLLQFATSLDHALNSSLSSKSTFNQDHVYKITLVRAK